MWPFPASSKSYRPLKNEVEDGEVIDLDEPNNASPPNHCGNIAVVVLIIAAIALMIISLIYGHITSFPGPTSEEDTNTTNSACPLRREWRTLGLAERQHYITSVQCLSTHPSTIPSHANSTLHEDFPWIHAHVGYATHNSAAFLPWHRYFLHLYHQTLVSQCNYTGELVYWDWTLDAADLAHAPVFDSATGFGGDGDPNGNVTVGNTGRCVIDGPFSNIHPNFYDVQYRPHCLSRGFRDDAGNLGVMDGHTITPSSIEEVLHISDYEAFNTEMESRVHDAIPFGIGGDFETFTAPYDPLFFLHHVQLDRLWWLWQERDLPARLSEYNGRKSRHSMEMAGLEDGMVMVRGFAREMRVGELMDIMGGDRGKEGLLCYRY